MPSGVRLEEELPLRLRIYEHVRCHPGTHILEISRSFGIAHPTAMYHLDVLERQGLLQSMIWGKRRVHFDARGRFTSWEREVLSVLALDEPRSILERVARHPGTFPRELARDLGISESTIKRHVPVLLRLHVLAEEVGSFRRRLFLSPGFRRRARNLLAKMPEEAACVPHLRAILDEGAPPPDPAAPG